MSAAHAFLRPESTVLVVVDIQEKLAPAIEGIDGIIANTRKLLRLARILPLRTTVTTQYRQGLGGTVRAIAELAQGEPIDKVCFGCMADEAFRGRLRELLPAGGTLLLAGVESHICVMQTALGALDVGYQVHIASDATGSRTPANAGIGLERMRQAGAVVSSTEMAIYELLGDSRGTAFKEMLPYLK